jgi:PAS domain S-box-containing protein
MSDVKILLVEDESVEAMDIKRTLESFNYEVPYVASSGEEAVEKALAIMPDLILMDIVLKGDIDGIEAVSKIKGLNIPIIYLTAHSEESTIEKAKLTEPFGYIIKPYDRTELKYAIELAIYKNKMEKKLKESEEKFKTIANFTYDWEYWVDPDGNLIYISPSCQRITGYRPDEFIQDSSLLERITHPNDIEIMSKHFHEDLKSEKDIDIIRYRIVTKNGEERWIGHGCKPVYNNKGTFLGRRASNRDITKIKQAEDNLNLKNSQMEIAQEMSGLGYWSYDVDSQMPKWSKEMFKVFDQDPEKGVPPYEKHKDFIQQDDWEYFDKSMQGAIKGTPYDIIIKVIFRDGSINYIHTQGHPLINEKGEIKELFGTSQDITHQKKKEEKIDKLYRFYATLSQVNQAMVRIKDQEELFNIICQASVEYGKFEMAWIGLIEHETGLIKPVAHYGHEDGYLELISININENPSSNKPTTMALHKGEIVIQNNIKKELKRSWHDEALKRNYRSLASIPIKLNAEIIGIFNIYSSEPDFFIGEEIKLVEEMGLDVSMAITAIESDKERKKVEKTLYTSEKDYHRLFNSMMDGFAVHEIILDDEGKPINYRFLKANPAMEKLTGLKVKEIVGKTVKEVLPNIEPIWIQRYGEVALTGKSIHFEEYNQDLDQYFKITAFSPKKGEFAAIFEDITDRKKTETELKFYIEWLDFAQNASKSGFWNWDMITDKLTWSYEFLELFGFPPETVPSFDLWEETLHPADREPAMNKINSSIENHEFLENEYRIIRHDGKERWIGAWGSTVYNEKNQPTRMSGICIDITERKQAETELIKSEERFRMMFEKSKAIMLLIDPDSGNIINANSSATEFYGYPLKTLQSMNINQINQLPLEEIDRAREQAKKEENKYFTFPHKLANGEIRKVEVFSSPIAFEDKCILFSIINDVTERKKAEEKIKKSLLEKEILLKEVHHRVKNNMQIISSLLNLQSETVCDDEVAVDVLKESQNRVKSMAMIHEKLYQSDDLVHINFDDYIVRLVSDLFYSYNISKEQIKSVLDVEDVKLNIETAVPLGLIISELVSNSLKHAFPEDKNGEVHISLIANDDKYELKISDNGIGIPEDFDFKNTESLGLQLVNNLVDQIDGKIILEISHGTAFKIIFKELKYKERL